MNDLEAKQRQALVQIAEIKRVLCAIEHALENRSPTAVLITSASHGEGKTLFASSLAATAAGMGRHRVAVLDLNWYRPSMHRFFGLELMHPARAIVNSNLTDLVFSSGSNAPDVLCAPIDHNDHSGMDGDIFNVGLGLIEQAKNAYDLVIVDSAAIFPTNRMMMDPVMLSGMVDGVAMVVLTGVTPRQKIKKAHTIMEIAGANVLGVVTNQWKMKDGQSSG